MTKDETMEAMQEKISKLQEQLNEMKY